MKVGVQKPSTSESWLFVSPLSPVLWQRCPSGCLPSHNTFSPIMSWLFTEWQISRWSPFWNLQHSLHLPFILSPVYEIHQRRLSHSGNCLTDIYRMCSFCAYDDFMIINSRNNVLCQISAYQSLPCLWNICFGIYLFLWNLSMLQLTRYGTSSTTSWITHISSRWFTCKIFWEMKDKLRSMRFLWIMKYFIW